MDATMSSLAIECKAMPPRSFLQTNLSIASKNPPRQHDGRLRLLFRPDLVVAQLTHEHFLVYGAPGVVEHRRDAGRAANFRALPGNDDQRRGRFLIAQDGHAQRVSSGDGG